MNLDDAIAVARLLMRELRGEKLEERPTNETIIKALERLCFVSERSRRPPSSPVIERLRREQAELAKAHAPPDDEPITVEVPNPLAADKGSDE